MLSCDNPNGGSEGALWKAKGLAMTCLANIVERMDREDLRRHVSKGLVASVVSIKKGRSTPPTQKGQAISLLQRYTQVANQCGVESFYKEAASPK